MCIVPPIAAGSWPLTITLCTSLTITSITITSVLVRPGWVTLNRIGGPRARQTVFARKCKQGDMARHSLVECLLNWRRSWPTIAVWRSGPRLLIPTDAFPAFVICRVVPPISAFYSAHKLVVCVDDKPAWLSNSHLVRPLIFSSVFSRRITPYCERVYVFRSGVICIVWGSAALCSVMVIYAALRGKARPQRSTDGTYTYDRPLAQPARPGWLHNYL